MSQSGINTYICLSIWRPTRTYISRGFLFLLWDSESLHDMIKFYTLKTFFLTSTIDNSKSMYHLTASEELCSRSRQCSTVKTWKQYMHFAKCTTEGKYKPGLAKEKHILNSLFPFHSEYSDQYCGRTLNICHQTITHR